MCVQTGTRRRVAGTAADGQHMPGKGDSRRRLQQIAAMWGGGPSAAGSSKFSKEAKIFYFYVKLPISKCCLKFFNMLCGAKYIDRPLACDRWYDLTHSHLKLHLMSARGLVFCS